MLSEVYYAFEALVRDRSEIQVDLITLASGQNLPANAVITKTFVGTAAGQIVTVAAGGNPTCSAVTVGALAEAGLYEMYMTDATHYEIFGPTGAYLGTGVFGTQTVIGNRLTFTWTAGVTACSAGDLLGVLVLEGASTWTASVTGSDAMGILGPPTNATSGAVQTVAITRLAEFNASMVNYGSLTANQIASANAALARKNIIARSGT